MPARGPLSHPNIMCPLSSPPLSGHGGDPAGAKGLTLSPVVARWVRGGGRGSRALGVPSRGDSVRERTRSPHPQAPGSLASGPPRLPGAAGPRPVVTSGGQSSWAFVGSGSVCVEALGVQGGAGPAGGSPVQEDPAKGGCRGREKGFLRRPQGDGGPVPWGRRLGWAGRGAARGIGPHSPLRWGGSLVPGVQGRGCGGGRTPAWDGHLICGCQ